MNHKDTVDLTTANLGRLLALHGRSSTADTFPVQNKFAVVECMKQLRSQEQGRDKASGEGGKKQAAVEGGDAEGGKDKADESKQEGEGAEEMEAILNKVKPRAEVEKVANPPLSKAMSSDKDTVQPSYSFYKRKFRVKGDNAWEYAMRDLGSVDTLFNRYGYVERGHRRETAEPTLTSGTVPGTETVASLLRDD